ncbi:cell division cycle protein 20 homolog isoform X2 [Hydra vulgaris]|uniref:Cell division cycle protein 20 homolog isoform X2 n=1 Tax=Hydra vulgaris TaxID=6087 RepID=A0ABM4B8F0_HYDVU
MADRKSFLKGCTREPLSPISNEIASSRTPCRRLKDPKYDTPSRSPGYRRKCTNNEGTGYDRFISNRALMDPQIGHHMFMKNDNENDSENNELSEMMKQSLGTADNNGTRILQMKIKPPVCKEGEIHMKTLYTKSKPTPAKSKSTRHIPATSDKILDAPYILDDYYLNLLDWGNCGLIAVPLSQTVYLWNAETGAVDELFGDVHAGEEDLVVTCVKWIQEGLYLAVGLSNGSVELWDAESSKRVRIMQGHASRVGSLDWNKHIVTSGARSGAIFNHDVRIANHHTASFLNHSQEVCGLQWSPDGKFLASGGNDNTLNIWDFSSISANTESVVENTTPLYSLTDHLAAVKAVSWCPWQRNLLASGGGTLDRHIRIWNTGTGNCLQSLDTMAQVSGILWSDIHKEIICSSGNQMTIYKYPQMTRETDLKGHTGRILNITLSPNGHIVASAGADETLRLWKCFEPDVKVAKPTKRIPANILSSDIMR